MEAPLQEQAVIPWTKMRLFLLSLFRVTPFLPGLEAEWWTLSPRKLTFLWTTTAIFLLFVVKIPVTWFWLQDLGVVYPDQVVINTEPMPVFQHLLLKGIFLTGGKETGFLLPLRSSPPSA